MQKILFIPGYLCTDALFQYQLDHLSDGISGTVADIPPLTTMEDIARVLWRKHPDPCIICGLSMGGIIAMEMVRQRPDLVQGLVLLDTNAKSEGAEVSAARQKLVQEGKLIGPGKMSLKRLLPKLVHPDRTEDEGLRAIIYQMAEECGVEKLGNHARALETRPDYSDPLREINCPTLIAYGAQDLLCPADRHDHIKSLILNAQYEVFANCGHLSPLEKPLEVSQLLDEWFLRC